MMENSDNFWIKFRKIFFKIKNYLYIFSKILHKILKNLGFSFGFLQKFYSNHFPDVSLKFFKGSSWGFSPSSFFEVLYLYLFVFDLPRHLSPGINKGFLSCFTGRLLGIYHEFLERCFLRFLQKFSHLCL